MKDRHEHSWFNYIKDLLDMYGLPSVFELLENPPSKSEWKDLLNNSLNSVIETEWEKRSSGYVRYVNPDVLRVGKCHTIGQL